jgi:hypothetical protein
MIHLLDQYGRPKGYYFFELQQWQHKDAESFCHVLMNKYSHGAKNNLCLVFQSGCHCGLVSARACFNLINWKNTYDPASSGCFQSGCHISFGSPVRHSLLNLSAAHTDPVMHIILTCAMSWKYTRRSRSQWWNSSEVLRSTKQIRTQ